MPEATLFADLCAAVLAAGGSRRLGRVKQLVAIDGETLIERAVASAQALCGSQVYVVLGAQRGDIAPYVEALGATIVDNPRWDTGLSSSIAAAIHALPHSARGVLLLTCDQPLVPAAKLHALTQRWLASPDAVVASAYADTLGVPAIFPRRLFTTLATLSGDRGAKRVLESEGTRVERVAVPEAAFDLDDEGALCRLASRSVPSPPSS